MNIEPRQFSAGANSQRFKFEEIGAAIARERMPANVAAAVQDQMARLAAKRARG